MWDFYAKRWRNAPLFEPIFAVSAATQTENKRRKEHCGEVIACEPLPRLESAQTSLAALSTWRTMAF